MPGLCEKSGCGVSMNLDYRRGDKIQCKKCDKVWFWVYDKHQNYIQDRCPYCFCGWYRNLSLEKRRKKHD